MRYFLIITLTILLCFQIWEFIVSPDPIIPRLTALLTNVFALVATVYQIWPSDIKDWFLGNLKHEEAITRRYTVDAKSAVISSVEAIPHKTADTIVTKLQTETPEIVIFRERLTSILEKVIYKRLNDTVHNLDRILLFLDVIEAPEAVITAATFRIFPIDDEQHEPDETQYRLEEIFQQGHHRLLLMGPGGAGKSTALAMFAAQQIKRYLDNPKGQLPIYVLLKDWHGEQPLQEWIVKQSSLPDSALDYIRQGKAFFLLDGLDELDANYNPESELRDKQGTEAKTRDLQVEFVEQFQSLSGNDIIVTSRNQDYDNLTLRSGKKLSLIWGTAAILQPLTNDQIQAYLHKEPELWSTLALDARLLEMARTPLLLRIFAVAFHGIGHEVRELALIEGGDGELRDKLFTTYVRQRRVHEGHRVPNLPSLDEIYDVLGQVAAENQWNKKRHLEELLRERADQFIKQMCQLHLLIQSDNGEINFIHQLIADFFAWRPLIDGLTSKGKISSYRAAQRLGQMKDRRAVQPLLDVLRKLNWTYDAACQELARALGKIGDPAAVPDLIGLLQHERTDVREAAVRALGAIKDERSIEPLIKALGDKKEDIQRDAAYALQQYGKAAGPAVTEALKDADMSIRAHSAWVLWAIKYEQAIPSLVQLLYTAHDRIEIPDPALVGGQLDPRSRLLRVDLKRGRFITADKDILSAIDVLGYFGSVAIKDLQSLYRSEKASLQEAAMRALCVIADEQLFEIFGDGLERQNEKIQVYAACGIAKQYIKLKITQDHIVDKLLALINQQTVVTPLYQTLLWVLSVINHPKSQAFINGLRWKDMPSEYDAVIQHIIGGLGFSQSEAALEAVLPFLHHANEQLRNDSIWALSRLKDARAIDSLMAVVKDTNAHAHRRSRAVYALGEIGHPSTVEFLITCLEDHEGYVRQSAVVALGTIRDQRAVEPLNVMLRDSKQSVFREEILKALKAINVPPENN